MGLLQSSTQEFAGKAEQDALDAGAADGKYGLCVDYAETKRAEYTRGVREQLEASLGIHVPRLGLELVKRRALAEHALQCAAWHERDLYHVRAAPLAPAQRASAALSVLLIAAAPGPVLQVAWPVYIVVAATAALVFLLAQPLRDARAARRFHSARLRAQRAQSRAATIQGVLEGLSKLEDRELTLWIASCTQAYARGRATGELLRQMRSAASPGALDITEGRQLERPQSGALLRGDPSRPNGHRSPDTPRILCAEQIVEI